MQRALQRQFSKVLSIGEQGRQGGRTAVVT
jgi:hypothetical protein